MFGHRTAPRSGGIRANPSRKRVSVIGIIALAIGLIPVTGSAREQDAKLTLAYDCRFPSGPQKVSVQIAGTLPSTGTSGESIRPTGAALTWTVPQSVLTGLTERGAIMLTAVATLTTTVAQQGAPATAAWTAGSSVPTPIPSANGLTLTAAATAPAVRAAEPGDVVFAAGALQMTITTMKADGTPTDPPALSVPCTPVQGQDARLGTVPIARPEESGTVPAPTATTDPSQVAPSAPAPAAGAAGAVAPCFGDKTNDFELVAYATGYSNVSKLNAAALVPPACTKIQQGETKVVPAPLSPDGFTHIYQVSVARLDYKGERRLPPATATFLTFGYMPTTATMELRQMPPKLDGEGVPVPNVKSDLKIVSAYEGSGTTTISLDLSLRLHDVQVNGVPLDVGPRCRTVRPFQLKMTGRGQKLPPLGEPSGYFLSSGGELNGKVTVPPFTGCGVGEDLDRIFTASVSGTVDLVRQNQGVPCAAKTTFGCTADSAPIDVPSPPK